jgi:hypothetical protein
MSVTIIQTPLKISLSGNPARVKLSTDLTGSEKAFLSLHLKVQKWTGAVWEDVGHDSKPVDSNNEAVFNIQDHLSLQTTPSFQYPEVDTLISRPEMIFRYRLVWYESYLDTTTNTITTTTETSNQVNYYALDGGIDDNVLGIYNQDNTNWLTELTTNQQFLTWQPATKQLHTGSIEKLYWLVQSATRLKLKVKRTNTDDTTSEFIAAELDVSAYSIIECSISPATLFTDTSNLKKYEIWLLDQNDNVISETRTYIIDRTYYERNDTFIFTNSLGAIDAIWARGNITEQVDHQRNRFTRLLDYDFTKDHKQATGRSLKQRHGEGEIGYVTETDPVSWKEYYALEFLGAKDHFKVFSSEQVLPVVITTEESLLLQDRQNVYSQPFKWHESRANRYYSRRQGTSGGSGTTYDYLLNESGEIITNEYGEPIYV